MNILFYGFNFFLVLVLYIEIISYELVFCEVMEYFIIFFIRGLV